MAESDFTLVAYRKRMGKMLGEEPSAEVRKNPPSTRTEILNGT
jgi:hypothetical protein